MRLNQYHKRAFVQAILNDIQSREYEKEANEFIQKVAFKRLPAPIRAALKDPESKSYLTRRPYYCKQCHMALFAVLPMDFKTSKEEDKVLNGIGTKIEAQKKERNIIREKLRNSINGCSTLKQAKERMPELAKYLPSEHEKTPNLPVPVDLINDLKKAGWVDHTLTEPDPVA